MKNNIFNSIIYFTAAVFISAMTLTPLAAASEKQALIVSALEQDMARHREKVNQDVRRNLPEIMQKVRGNVISLNSRSKYKEIIEKYFGPNEKGWQKWFLSISEKGINKVSIVVGDRYIKVSMANQSVTFDAWNVGSGVLNIKGKEESINIFQRQSPQSWEDFIKKGYETKTSWIDYLSIESAEAAAPAIALYLIAASLGMATAAIAPPVVDWIKKTYGNMGRALSETAIDLGALSKKLKLDRKTIRKMALADEIYIYRGSSVPCVTDVTKALAQLKKYKERSCVRKKGSPAEPVDCDQLKQAKILSQTCDPTLIAGADGNVYQFTEKTTLPHKEGWVWEVLRDSLLKPVCDEIKEMVQHCGNEFYKKLNASKIQGINSPGAVQ